MILFVQVLPLPLDDRDWMVSMIQICTVQRDRGLAEVHKVAGQMVGLEKFTLHVEGLSLKEDIFTEMIPT